MIAPLSLMTKEQEELWAQMLALKKFANRIARKDDASQSAIYSALHDLGDALDRLGAEDDDEEEEGHDQLGEEGRDEAVAAG